MGISETVQGIGFIIGLRVWNRVSGLGIMVGFTTLRIYGLGNVIGFDYGLLG